MVVYHEHKTQYGTSFPHVIMLYRPIATDVGPL